MMKNVLLVALGGGVGSVIRYLCQKWINEVYVHSFPLATFLVNVSGCFLIGAIFAAAEKLTLLTPSLRLLLITGFCGGFTTFSTFAFENVNLLRTGDFPIFLFYTAGSLVLGVIAVWAGFTLIKLL